MDTGAEAGTAVAAKGDLAAVSIVFGTERMEPLTKRLYVTSGGLASLCRWMLSDGVFGGEGGDAAAALGNAAGPSAAVKMGSRRRSEVWRCWCG